MSDVDKIVVQKMNYISSKTTPISKDYTVGKTLGEGAFGAVRVGVHKMTKQKRAIKILKKSKIDNEELRKEVDILSKLSHPNIMQIYEVYNDETNFYIVSELCAGGELFDTIEEKGTFDEGEACKIMHQLLSGICYSHSNNIVHRDLKPENILLEEKGDSNFLLKIIDWGCAIQMKKNEKLHSADGTPYYIAPEVLEGNYDEKCDIWSSAVIFYVMLCGYPPFNGETNEEILENVKKGEYEFPPEEWDQISKEAKDLISKMLTFNPAKRISALDALQHPWFTKFKDNKSEENKSLAKTAFNNMKKFKRNRKLEQVTIGFITNQLLSKEDRMEMRKLFVEWDKNGDGVLSKEEILEGYRRTYGRIDENEIINMIKSIDMDNNGYIDYNEFLACAVSREKVLSKENLEYAFTQIDSDLSGKISVDEIRSIFAKSNNQNIDVKVFEGMLKDADANGDGEIEFEEYKNIMIKFFS